MNKVSFRCSFCYRVHTVDRAKIGFVLSCACGNNFRVPDVDADESTPAESLPLAELVTTGAEIQGLDDETATLDASALDASPVFAEASVGGLDVDLSSPRTPPVIPRFDEEDVDEAEEREVASSDGSRSGVEWDDFESVVESVEEEASEALVSSGDASDAEDDFEGSAPPADAKVAAFAAMAPAGDDALGDGWVEPGSGSRSGLAPRVEDAEHASREWPTGSSAGAVASAGARAEAISRTAQDPASRGSATEKRQTTMGRGFLIAAAVAFVAWLVHTSPWIYFGLGSEPLPKALGLVPHTHYLLLERALWSALLFGLTVALLGEGWMRRRRALAWQESSADESF
ncbi:MAG TPA: hypothetical protein VK116_14385 [Planctomycetota bacterium]|nr:hypothetical protein [Planctomycetota bacterium]